MATLPGKNHAGDNALNDISAVVRIAGAAGRSFSLKFTGVSELKAVQPEGMLLYALCEMSAPAPGRRFVFANWSEEDSSSLEIVATGFQIVAQQAT